jgi:hypothetical protein
MNIEICKQHFINPVPDLYEHIILAIEIDLHIVLYRQQVNAGI